MRNEISQSVGRSSLLYCTAREELSLIHSFISGVVCRGCLYCRVQL